MDRPVDQYEITIWNEPHPVERETGLGEALARAIELAGNLWQISERELAISTPIVGDEYHVYERSAAVVLTTGHLVAVRRVTMYPIRN